MDVGSSTHYNMRFIWITCLVAAMGGLLFGYDWVVIGGAKPFYEPFFNISSEPWSRGFAMSSALIGCLFGAVVAGLFSDRFGRKWLLVFAGMLFTASAIGTAYAWDFLSFNTFRWLGGVGIGLASNLSPMYIAEISPAHARGKFVSINQLTIVLGILAAQLMNWAIADPVPTADQLRLLMSDDAEVLTVYGHDYDLAAERRKASAVTDLQALEHVKQCFTGVAVTIPANETREKLKAAEDQQLLDTYLIKTWNGQLGWRWMFGIEAIPAALFFLLMFFVPESPRWLVKYGHDAKATRILARVGGNAYAEQEVANVKQTLATEEIGRVRFRDLLEPKLLRIIGLVVFLVVLQQWCGINVIFNYAQDIFSEAGYGVSDIMWNIVITGIVNLLFTFVAIYTVDRFGRKTLMLIGAGGLACIYGILGAGYYLDVKGTYMLVLVVSAIAFYAMSLAPVTWVLVSELFPNRIRGAAMSIAVFSLWASCTLLTFTFPFLQKDLGAHGTFWLYGSICAIGFLVIWDKLPETKGKSLEQIEHELVD